MIQASSASLRGSSLGSLHVAFMDDALQDVNAAMRDIEGFMDTAMGKRLEKAPIAVFRIANVVIVALIAAEMMAIYRSNKERRNVVATYRWIDHRATMLWVSLKCLVFLTVGVSLVVAIGDLSSGASTALSIAVAGIGFFSGSRVWRS